MNAAVVDHHLAVDHESRAIIRSEVEIPDAGGWNLDLAGEAKPEGILSGVRSDARDGDSDRIGRAADLVDGAHPIEVAVEVMKLQAWPRRDRLEHALAGEQIGGE